MRHRISTWAAGVGLLVLVVAGGCDVSGPSDERGAFASRRAGGAMTVFKANSQAFSSPPPNLEGERLARHQDGDVAFEQKFVTAPAEQFGGVGPVYNARSCGSCHVRDGHTEGTRILHTSAPGTGPHGGPALLDGFGLQIQGDAVFGVAPEAVVAVDWKRERRALAGGTTVTLRAPDFKLQDAYMKVPTDAQFSARTPRPVFGLGLLEAVPAATIRALAAKQARNGHVSGQANRVWDRATQRLALGRFGWKADNPSVRQQTADAYHRDMGITSPLYPRESTLGQDGYDDGLDDDPEITRRTLDAATFYVQTLGVPARRDVGHPAVQRGSALFEKMGCASCHVRRLQTGRPEGTPKETHDQTIYPYTDMLVHDMGEGLADGRPVYEANGREWRTPPLWGLGLSQVVNGHTNLLHDGRARNATEAILWHGGEAKAAREAFQQLSKGERDDLLTFLHAL